MKSTIERKTKEPLVSKIPGLWVNRRLKSQEQREKHGIPSQRPDESRDEYEARVPEAFSRRFYYQFHRAGHESKQVAIKADHVQTKAQAIAYAEMQVNLDLKRIEAEKKAEAVGAISELERRTAAVKAGKWCTVGELIRALQEVLDDRGLQTADRSFSNLRMVIAVAHGLLVPRSGKRINEVIQAKVDAMKADVICDATAEAYALAVQKAAGVTLPLPGGKWKLDYNRLNPPRVNVTINTNLGMAKVPLHKKYRVDAVRKLAVPWAQVETFGALRLPMPTKDVGEELPSGEAYTAMLEGWKVLQASSEPEKLELALVNEMLRKLGLRSGELCMARRSWLVKLGDGWFLKICDRPDEGAFCKGDASAVLPLEADLAQRLLARCDASGLENPFLILPAVPGGEYDTRKRRNAEHADRARMVRSLHNEWVKGFIGESPSGQGNHRLRKLCATTLYRVRRRKAEADGADSRAAHKMAAAVVKGYLRHESEATSLLHYIAPDMVEALGTALTDADMAEGCV